MIEIETDFFKALVEHSTDMIVAIDPAGTILYHNLAVGKILNYGHEEMKGKDLIQFIHTDDVGSFRKLLALSGRWKESPFTTAVRFRRADGRWIPLESRGIALTDHPSVKGIVIVSREVDESRSQQGPRNDEVLLRAIAESATHAIVAIDEPGTIVFANPAVEKLFGHTSAELIGKSLDILIPDHLRPYHHRGLERYLETGVRHTSWSGREVYALHATGREIPVQISYQEYWEEGKRYFAGIIEDITERKEAEQRLLTQFAVTRCLASSWNLNETIPHMLKAIGSGLGFDVAELWLVDNGILAFSGDWYHSRVTAEEFRTSGIGLKLTPGQGIFGRVWSSGEPRWVEHLQDEPLFVRARAAKVTNLVTGAFVAIRVRDKVVGVLGLFSRAARRENPELLQFLEILGGQIGDLLERKRGDEERAQLLLRERTARTAAQSSEQRLSFQADVSLILSSSLDYFGSLSQIARLVVPRIADWCAVDIVDTNKAIQRVTLVHRDPAKAEMARELRVRYPPSFQGRRGVPNVIRTGKSELFSEIPDDLIRQQAQNEEHFNILKRFGLKSAMIVPLRIRGQTIGVITFATAESGRTFGPQDLAFAEDLARRSAIAVDNARLYQRTQESLNDLKVKAAEVERLNAELEQRVVERTAQLEEANRELEAFSYSVSHDLRAPVRSINGFTQILSDDHSKALDSEGRRLLGIVQQSAERMGRLIDDLLRFSRVGRQATQLTDIDMTRLARETFEELIRSEGERPVDFHLATLPSAHGDSSMIRQVWANLLSNALKFTPKDRPAVISVIGGPQGAFNLYSVRDNGVGFNMDYSHKLFGVFQRLHGDEEFPGTGVGLALVQRIIHRHGGTITAHSVPNSQTIFSFTLPKGSDVL